MKQYLVTNPSYTGEAILLYNGTGLLQKIDLTQTDMDANTVARFKRAVPATSDLLAQSFSEQTTIVASELIVAFEEFWLKYDHKYNKARCEAIWERLTKSEKIQAFYSLDKYFKYLRKHSTQAKLHPDSYLRNKAWLNDYK